MGELASHLLLQKVVYDMRREGELLPTDPDATDELQPQIPRLEAKVKELITEEVIGEQIVGLSITI